MPAPARSHQPPAHQPPAHRLVPVSAGPPPCRHPFPDQQLAACRALVRTLPAVLPPGSAAQLLDLGHDWLGGSSSDAPPGASCTSTGAVSGTAGASVQLQAEAARLFLALLSTPRFKLQPLSSQQLLHQLRRLCRQQARPAQSSSLAAGELTCGCVDLLAQLPQWYPQVPKAELAEASAAVAATLEQQALVQGVGGCAGVAEAPAMTRLLCKQLKALQVLLAEVSPPGWAHVGAWRGAMQASCCGGP